VVFSSRLVEAFEFALHLHRSQRRKGSESPYFIHLMAVAAIVGEYGGDEQQVIAALLHDAVEDQGGQETLAEIHRRFGEDVAEYVAACSDADTDPKPPWLERKRQFLKTIATAPSKVKLIVAADKLHNVRSIVNDLHQVGNDVWLRFRGGRQDTLWYYGEVVRALTSGWSHPILRELAEAVDKLQRTAYRLDGDTPHH
jgi:(p)ppGpp synthase/HD superfamily hydrolase